MIKTHCIITHRTLPTLQQKYTSTDLAITCDTNSISYTLRYDLGLRGKAQDQNVRQNRRCSIGLYIKYIKV